ncbi:S-layer homology domain-containing protein [Anaerotignum sp.]
MRKRRLLAWLMAMVMAIGLMPATALADEPPVAENLSPATTTVSNVAELDKTAKDNGGGTYDVTVSVKAKQEIKSEAVEIVLVLDSSGSMNYCTATDYHEHTSECYGLICGKKAGREHWHTYECYGYTCGYTHVHSYPSSSDRPLCSEVEAGTADSRMDIVQARAEKMVKDIVEKQANVKIGIVDFDSNVQTANSIGLTPATAENQDTLLGKIDAMDPEGGTDYKDGLDQAYAYLNNNSGAKKVVIFLTDGKNNDKSFTEQDKTVTNLKNIAEIYTIGFTTSNALLEAIATDAGHYKTANDSTVLESIFNNIVDKLIALVTDPIGEYVTLEGDVTAKVGTADAASGLNVSDDKDNIEWNRTEGLASGETLTLTYTVALKDAEDFPVGATTVYLNGDGAKLNYTVGTTSGKASFPQPYTTVEVGQLTEKTVLVGEDAAETEYGTAKTAKTIVSVGSVSQNAEFTWTMPAADATITEDGTTYYYHETKLDGTVTTAAKTDATAAARTVVHYYTAEEPAPAKPTSLNVGLDIVCTDHTTDQPVGFDNSSYTIGDVEKSVTGGYAVKVTLDGEKANYYPAQHEADNSQTDVTELTFTWNGTSWLPEKDNFVLHVKPVVTPPPAETYTVTYTDGVALQEIFPDQVTSGLHLGDETPAFVGEPTREGYTFDRWDPKVTPTVTGTVVYTAKWTKDPIGAYDTEFHTMFTEAIGNKVKDSTEDVYDFDDVSLINVTAGSTTATGGGKIANYKALGYDHWFTLNTVDIIKDVTKVDGLVIKVKTGGSLLRPEYQDVVVDADHIKKIHDVSWSGIDHITEIYLGFDVTFKAKDNAGEWQTVPCNGNDTNVVFFDSRDGGTITPPALDDGYIWYTDEACTQEWNGKIVRDTILYAGSVEQVVLMYNPNGGYGFMMPTTYNKGTEVTAADCGYTRTGYNFVGWSKTTDGATLIQPGDKFALNETTTLYAIWSKGTAPAGKFTLTYDPNGGEGTAYTETYSKDENVTVADCSFTAPEGYEFAGWSEAADGQALVQPGDMFLINASTTLYAIWKPETVIVRFYLEDDALTGEEYVTTDLGDEIRVDAGYAHLKSVESDKIVAGTYDGDVASDSVTAACVALFTGKDLEDAVKVELPDVDFDDYKVVLRADNPVVWESENEENDVSWHVHYVVVPKEIEGPEFSDDGAQISGSSKEALTASEVRRLDLAFAYPGLLVPENGTILISAEDLAEVEEFKIAYKITVTGDAGTAFSVTDEDVEWVDVDDAFTVDGDTVSGRLDENGEAVLYCVKTFTAEDAEEGSVANEAVIVNESDPEQPEIPIEEETVIKTEGVAVTKTLISKGPFKDGDDVEFKITVTNLGNEPVENIIVVEEPGSGLVKGHFVGIRAGVDSDSTPEEGADSDEGEDPVDGPAVGVLAVDVLAADEPAADEPAADEPAADEPAADEPAADEPEIVDPAENNIEVTASDDPQYDNTYTDEDGNVVILILEAGQSIELTYTAEIDADKDDFSNTVIVIDGEENELDRDENKEVQLSKGSISVTKEIGDKSVRRGEWAVYTIVVENTGEVDLKDITVTEKPDYDVFSEGEFTGNVDGVTFDGDTATIDELEVGDSVTLTYRAKVKSGAAKNAELENVVIVKDGNNELGRDTNNDGYVYVPSSSHSSSSSKKKTPSKVDEVLNTEDHFQYVQGYPDDTVGPERNITRAEATVIFFRLLQDSVRTKYLDADNTFPDVNLNDWFNLGVSTMENGGFVSGYDDGLFRPNGYITRAELATIISNFDDLEPATENKFPDVEGHWAEKYINSAAEKGWLSGYDDGLFRPNQYITRAETMSMINRVLDRKVDEDGLHEDAKQWKDNPEGKWYYYAVLEATNYHEYEREDASDYENWTAIKPEKVWEN